MNPLQQAIEKQIPDWRLAPTVQRVYEERQAVPIAWQAAAEALRSAESDLAASEDALVELETRAEFGGPGRGLDAARDRVERARKAVDDRREYIRQHERRLKARDQMHAEVVGAAQAQTASAIAMRGNELASKMAPIIEALIPMAEELALLANMERGYFGGGDPLNRTVPGIRSHLRPGVPLFVPVDINAVRAMTHWLQRIREERGIKAA